MYAETMITVKGKVVGQARPVFPDWSLPLPPEMGSAGQLTLRALITRIVLEEVEVFKLRQQERRLTRVLSPADIGRGAVSGKVSMGGLDGRSGEQEVDADAAVAAALQAFEDRFYYVFIDDVQGEALDQPVNLRLNSAVTFLRLVPLAGG